MSIQPEHTIRILGIESSCDETAAAVVENGHQNSFKRSCHSN